jgi:DNA polymerase III gamma/tau subunit
MYAWSKALAVALVITLGGYGTSTLQAKGHKDHNNQCQKPSGCPAPVIQTPTVESNCCPMGTVQSHCGAPVQTGCCPVDPKEVSKAEKEALHAQHEAAEACKKRQKAIAKAQQELEEETAKQQARIDKANDHFNHEVAEFNEANAKYDAFYGSPSTEETAAVIVVPQPEVQPAPPAPQPEPTPSAEITPPQQQEEIAAVIETTPAPEPKQLPRTAGEMNLIGLIGMLSLTGGYFTRFFRR